MFVQRALTCITLPYAFFSYNLPRVESEEEEEEEEEEVKPKKGGAKGGKGKKKDESEEECVFIFGISSLLLALASPSRIRSTHNARTYILPSCSTGKRRRRRRKKRRRRRRRKRRKRRKRRRRRVRVHT